MFLDRVAVACKNFMLLFFKQLLKTLPVLQQQVDALLEFDVSTHTYVLAC